MYTGIFWMMLDAVSYLFITKNAGISKSYGIFLNLWIILSLLYQSIKLTLIQGLLYGSCGFFITLFILWALLYKIESNFNKISHRGRPFDRAICLLTQNTIGLIFIANIGLHVFYFKDASPYLLIHWSLT